jgi:hypothetical protein
MNSMHQTTFPLWVPLLVPALRLFVTTLLSFLAGWFSLARAFPDRPDERPLLHLKGQSGSMGLYVGMNGILTLSPCTTGLRVSMLRVFGPFDRPFLVPWREIHVTRKLSSWWPRVDLGFGSVGHLTVDDYTANKLWRATPDRWPEPGPIPAVEPRSAGIGVVARWWLIRTVLASAFFLWSPRVATSFLSDPRFAGPKPPDIPIAVAVGFPAVAFAIFSLVDYARRR